MTTLTAPGPSPWYLRAPWARIVTSAGACTWKTYDDATLSGLSQLALPSGETILLVDFYCYLQPLSNDLLLIWHEAAKRIVFTILDLPALQILEDGQEIAAEMKRRKETLRFKGGNPALYEFVTAVEEGDHAIAPPQAFRDLPEVLALADFAPDAVASNYFDRMRRAIFAFDFRSGRVKVMPQKWFNDGRFDFGYQWITRVQRDPETGRIIGEGIRLGTFRLDASGTAIESWLHQDLFYHPEGQFVS